MTPESQQAVERYPLPLRLLHWTRAVLVLGMIVLGWQMASLPLGDPLKYVLYPWHKSFGLLVFLIAIVQLAIRSQSRLPEPPVSLARYERILSRIVHRTIYVLLIVVPVMGYSMSSTFKNSSGVSFFGLPLPELLPKNETWNLAFQWLHMILAYLLLALIVLHVSGAIKHRFFDRDRRSDVLPRML